MTILITRPLPQGESLSKQLQQLGFSTCYTPLIRIIAGQDTLKLPQLLAKLPAHSKIIVLSPQVSYLQAALPVHWSEQFNYYAIGAQSAKLFTQITQQVITFPSHDETSEGLLALDDFQQIQQQHIVLLRGNGGRELLATELTRRGAVVHPISCYQRQLINYPAAALLQNWLQQGISAIVVTSSQILMGLVDIMQQVTTQSAWLYHLPLITVSERLAKQAQQLGWSTIYLTERANNQAITDCILSLKLKTEPYHG